MGSTNICAPPQTYSRLFRPWDTKMECQEMDIIKSAKTKEFYENEAEDSGNVDIMSDSEDNECSSSSRSSASSIDPVFDSTESDSLLQAPLLITPPNSARNSFSPSDSKLPNVRLYTSTPQRFENHEAQLQHQQQQHHQQPYQQLTMFSGIAPSTANPANNNFYYASALANGVNMSTSLPNFSMDPYPFGLMEQGFARVLLEEAHLKTLNQRKQRPKKFKCPHCDVAFSNNGQLKGHIRIHTGERPFKCDAESCGKTFTRNEELTRHKRIHTGLRPYPCPACGKKFGRRDHLKKHMKTHMPQEHPLGGSAAYFMPMFPYMYGL